jgi:competence protein ComEA
VVLCAIAFAAGLLVAAGRIRSRELVGEPGAEAPLRPQAWRVDLNQADASQLECLPGVGPGLALRIVADRASRGPFSDPGELDRVPGVGPALIERIRPFVR